MEETNKGEQFGFPYKPYDIQLDLMNAIYEAMDTGKVAILESPTGTGKSLSVICAAMTWLENEKQNKAKEIERQLQILKQQIKGKLFQ